MGIPSVNLLGKKMTLELCSNLTISEVPYLFFCCTVNFLTICYSFVTSSVNAFDRFHWLNVIDHSFVLIFIFDSMINTIMMDIWIVPVRNLVGFCMRLSWGVVKSGRLLFSFAY